MIKKNGSKYLLAILLVLHCFSCSKGENGENGPQGSQGEQGIPGEEGEVGGITYHYSDWISVEFPNPLGLIEAIPIEEPLLTNEFLSQGMVLGYARLTSGEVVQLPYSNTEMEQVYSLDPRTNLVRILVRRGGVSAPTTPLVESFRYILIAGTVEENGLSIDDLSDMTYDEIGELLELPQ